jgi:hypothetical protein
MEVYFYRSGLAGRADKLQAKGKAILCVIQQGLGGSLGGEDVVGGEATLPLDSGRSRLCKNSL